MAARKKAAEASAPAEASRKKGLVKAMVRLRPGQVAALRTEAFRRAAATGSGRPDASEVLREILDGNLDPALLSKPGKPARGGQP